jgi:hypothetical protein
MEHREKIKKVARKIIKKSMEVELGEKGTDKTFQKEFPKEIKCCKCGADARLAFVAHEKKEGFKGPYVCNLYKNDPEGEGFWMHDACCVAVYLCKKCLEPTAIANQA